MVAAISKEVGEVAKTHKARSAEWYNEVGFLSQHSTTLSYSASWDTNSSAVSVHLGSPVGRARAHPCSKVEGCVLKSALKEVMQLKKMTLGEIEYWLEGASAMALEKEPMHMVRRRAPADMRQQICIGG